ncbi:hypothetical protein CVT26_000441 [Gymnopilus dilepis]|uniref:Major facilitator superfamily (MFS) profile domain-containing protein n=1 Tax=Gymnopilus dilepis TaxID=231916 RepID=A0A409YU35_9AGAR|nr:hypothetical protein CVT26_000441 [Gymnopilus dilepis]
MPKGPAPSQSIEGQRYSTELDTVEDSGRIRADLPVFDRGKEAWLTVLGCWLVQFCTYGYVSAFGVYQDHYSRSFLSQEHPSSISWIGSFQLFLQYAPGVIVGKAFDAGYFRHMMALGTSLQTISMFMLSLTHRNRYYEVFLAQAVGMGLGQSILFLPSLTVIGHHFKRRRALATGIATSGASVGGIIWPICLNQLSQRTTFANAIRTTAALCGLMLFGSNFLMKARTMAERNLPEEVRFRTILRDSAYLVSVISAFCINLGLFFPYFYLQLYTADLKLGGSAAFYSLAILNAGGALGRILPNFLADKFGIYNLLLSCLLISSGLAFSLLAISKVSGVIGFAFFFGFSSGSYISLIPSLLAQLSSHAGEHG